MGASAVSIIGNLLGSCAVALFIICQTTNAWLYSSGTEYGLWRYCVNSVCFNLGWSFISEFLQLTVTRCIFLLCDVIAGIGLVCIIAGCFVKDSKSLFTAGGGLYISAGIIITIGCIFFTVFSTVAPNLAFALNDLLGASAFGYSFYIGWVSGPLYIAAGTMLVVCAKSRTSHQVQPHTQQQVIWTTNTGPQETHTIAVQQQKTYYA